MDRRCVAREIREDGVIWPFNPAIGKGLRAETQPGAMAATPSEMKWSAQGGLALPGMEQTLLVGDPGKPGPYTLRLIPQGTSLRFIFTRVP